uniref:Uncharacterized protein AlNc14C126G6830 n=1 Tax=Albugo laibachii Nc14 TaxID=890382 RepID=F0WJW4_9STRA|nr:conserved hypothetical protein [Albugo laibachii Nc14]|eukprot:CCA21566.1 conserved hypothetical protein [Albugo laibachii Nc14]
MVEKKLTSDPKQLIFEKLQQYKCLPEDSIQNNQNWCDSVFNFEAVVAIAAKMLNILISQSKKLHFAAQSNRDILEFIQNLAKFDRTNTFSWPTSVATRHRLGAQLAQLVKEIGYTGECGYNHFLYPNEKETLELFSWLIEQIIPANGPHVNVLDGANGENSIKCTASSHNNLSTLGSQYDKHDMDEEDVLSAHSIKVCLQNWKKQKTLYAWPNTQIPALHGYQKLAFRTSPLLRKSWYEAAQCTSVDQDNEPLDLFDKLPLGVCKITSLSEALTLSISITDPLQKVLIPGSLIQDDPDDEAMDFANTEGFPQNTASSHCDDQDKFLDQNVSFTDTIDASAAKEPSYILSESRQEHVIHAESLEGCELEVDTARTCIEGIRIVQPVFNNVEEIKEALHDEQNRIERAEQQIAEMYHSGRTLQREVSQYRKLMEMMVDPESNFDRLKALRDRNESQLSTFTKEWEQHEEKLSEKETVLESKYQAHQKDHNHLIMCVKRVRRELKRAKLVLQEKSQTLQEVESIHKLLPKTKLTRKGYTNGILEVIKQIHKQKQDIVKIIQDIRVVQKQLNSQGEKLKRVETVGDEKLFRLAKASLDSAQPNPFTSAASSSTVASTLFPSTCPDKSSVDLSNKNLLVENYRKFTEIRQLYEELLGLIEDIGKAEDASRDLANWVSQAESRDSGRYLEQITNDIATIRQESEELLRQAANR